MLSINRPWGVGSNQKVGNLRERIKPRSTKWIILPPSTELRARRSGCHAIIPSALPFSSNDNISANLIRPGSLAVLASQSEANLQNLQFPQWCSILELVRTHFCPENSERLRRKISKPPKSPEKQSARTMFYWKEEKKNF